MLQGSASSTGISSLAESPNSSRCRFGITQRSSSQAEITFADGTTEHLCWNTFKGADCDLDVTKEVTGLYSQDHRTPGEHLMAVTHSFGCLCLCGEIGHQCFFVEPDIWDLLDRCAIWRHGAELLPEIHVCTIPSNLRLRSRQYVYDTTCCGNLYTSIVQKSSCQVVERWRSDEQFTTLDTHDGIGVVDVKDILTNEEIDYASNEL